MGDMMLKIVRRAALVAGLCFVGLIVYGYINERLPAAEKAYAVAAHPHHWLSYENGEYLYEVAASPDEKAAGAAANKIMRIRYYGDSGGVITLKSDSGSPLEVTNTCSYPCKIITMSGNIFGVTQSQQIVFNNKSVIGSAFEDAMNGYLEEAKPAPQTDAVKDCAKKEALNILDKEGPLVEHIGSLALAACASITSKNEDQMVEDADVIGEVARQTQTEYSVQRR